MYIKMLSIIVDSSQWYTSISHRIFVDSPITWGVAKVVSTTLLILLE